MGNTLEKWQPTRYDRHIRSIESSTGVALIKTDAGEAYLKALGNREGPHALVREWIGSSLAQWLGLPTFDFALMTIRPGDVIPLGHGKLADPGHAFVTRAIRGRNWSGRPKELKHVTNPESITGLVILDTWLLNSDRCPPAGSSRQLNRDNVFFAHVKGRKSRLIAMDFSHCLLSRSDLSSKLMNIEHSQDDRIYGLFAEFRPYLSWRALGDSITRLQHADNKNVEPMVRAIPDDWDVSHEVRQAVVEFLARRARFLAVKLRSSLGPQIESSQLDML